MLPLTMNARRIHPRKGFPTTLVPGACGFAR
jgi:hypothetical protein